jgi:nucleoside-diphosphate-sugar epimerase
MSKRVIVTGAAGHVGKAVINKILGETDWEVVKIQRDDYDLRLPISFNFEVNYVIHCAANRYGTIWECTQDNIIGTHHVLEWAKKRKIEKFVFLSSNDVFGAGSTPKDEDAPFHPVTPYAATKAAAEQLCIESGLPFIVCHVVNVICTPPDPSKFPSVCRRKILNDEKVTIYEGKRSYIHVDDLADALLFLMKNNHYGKFNIVGEEISNFDIVVKASTELNKPMNYEIIKGGEGRETEYNLSGAKMAQLGWKIKKRPYDYI